MRALPRGPLLSSAGVPCWGLAAVPAVLVLSLMLTSRSAPPHHPEVVKGTASDLEVRQDEAALGHEKGQAPSLLTQRGFRSVPPQRGRPAGCDRPGSPRESPAAGGAAWQVGTFGTCSSSVWWGGMESEGDAVAVRQRLHGGEGQDDEV